METEVPCFMLASVDRQVPDPGQTAPESPFAVCTSDCLSGMPPLQSSVIPETIHRILQTLRTQSFKSRQEALQWV